MSVYVAAGIRLCNKVGFNIFFPSCRFPTKQGRNHRKKLVAISAMVVRICPPGGNRVKVSKNLGATAVILVAHVDTTLQSTGAA